MEIASQTGKCCRIRLFVSDRAEAESTIGKKLPEGFDKTNTQINYAGGNETIVNESARTYSTNINEMIAQKAEDIFKLMSAHGFLYSQNHSGINEVDKANTPDDVKEACRTLGLKYAPSGFATLIAQNASPSDKARKWPNCDCSLFTSWVLKECGVMKGGTLRAISGDYLAGKIPLESGYHLESIPSPEMGCILSKPNHVALALSTATKADFGGTKWWDAQVPAERKGWEGNEDCKEHRKKINIYSTP